MTIVIRIQRRPLLLLLPQLLLQIQLLCLVPLQLLTARQPSSHQLLQKLLLHSLNLQLHPLTLPPLHLPPPRRLYPPPLHLSLHQLVRHPSLPSKPQCLLLLPQQTPHLQLLSLHLSLLLPQYLPLPLPTSLIRRPPRPQPALLTHIHILHTHQQRLVQWGHSSSSPLRRCSPLRRSVTVLPYICVVMENKYSFGSKYCDLKFYNKLKIMIRPLVIFFHIFKILKYNE